MFGFTNLTVYQQAMDLPINHLQRMGDLTIDTEGEMLTIDGLIHRLEMNLVATILHTHHADILPIEELGVARGTSLADRLLETETVGCLAEDTDEALVGVHHCVLLQEAG